MNLIYKIVNFKKINLNDVVKFLTKYGYKMTMAVKMSGTGMGFRLYDDKKKCGILSQGGKSISDEEKEEIINKYVLSVGYEDKFCELYRKCDYEFYVEVRNEECKLKNIINDLNLKNECYEERARLVILKINNMRYNDTR